MVRNRHPRQAQHSVASAASDTVLPMPDLELQMVQAFPTTLTRAHLGVLEPFRAQLLADVLEMAETEPVVGAPGRQTRGILQDREEPRWKQVFETMLGVVNYLGSRDQPDVQRRWTFKSWGLVYDQGSAYETVPEMTHSHAGYTFSTVLWLDVPDSLIASKTGGTSFRDPLSFVRRGLGEGEGIWHAEPPAILDLLVFPSYLEHLPTPPGPDTIYDRPRVVIATDFLRV